MPRGDQNAAPTVEQEMAKFTGFAQKDGETIAKEGENLNPTLDGAAAAAKAGETKTPAPKEGEKAPAAAAKAEKLTDDESNTVIEALDTKLGREATDDEIAAALAEAQAAKNPPPAGKPKATVADRIGKAVSKQRAAERDRDAAIRRAEVAEALLKNGAPKQESRDPLTADPKTAKTGPVAGEPDPKDFEFGELDARYIRAVARFDAQQEIAAEKAKDKEKQQTAAQAEAAAKFQELKVVFEDTGTEKYPDFVEVVMEGARNKEWELSDGLGALLFESEYGPDVAYMLASDPKLAQKIAAMPVLKQASWLGQEEAKLSASSGAKGKTDDTDPDAAAKDKSDTTGTPKVSKAPAPIARARGQGSASSVSGDTQDFAAFEAAAMGQGTK